MTELPKGWEWVCLADITEINPKLPFENIPDVLEVTFLPMKHVEERSNKISLVETRKYGDVKKGFVPMTDGDVIFAKISPCMENGKVAIVHSLRNHIAFGSTEFHVFRMKGMVIGKFVFHYLNREDFRRNAQGMMTGAVGQRRVPRKFLEESSIPLPPLAEQERIVARIEELFSSLDKGIESLKTAQAQLKTYRQAVLKWAFEGRFTNADVPEGELPAGWKWVKLGDLTKSIEAGKSFKCDERPPSERETGVLKVSAVTWGVFDENESKTVTDPEKINSNYLVRIGDFLFSRANTLDLIGAVVRVHALTKKLLLSDKTLRLSFHTQIVNEDWVLHFLRCQIGRKQIQDNSSGNQESMRNIGQEGIRRISIPLPPTLDEQARVVAEIEARLSVCDQVEAGITRGLEQAEALRQSILKRAFEGKLVPQDPADEPASALLARIRAAADSSAAAGRAGKDASKASSGRKRAKVKRDGK